MRRLLCLVFVALLVCFFNTGVGFADDSAMSGNVAGLEKKLQELQQQMDALQRETDALKSQMRTVEAATPAATTEVEMPGDENGHFVTEATLMFMKPHNQTCDFAISDIDNDYYPTGDFVSVNPGREPTPKLKLGYVFPGGKDRVDVSGLYYRGTDSKYVKATTDGLIWSILSAPDETDATFRAARASQKISLTLIDADYTKTLIRTPKWNLDVVSGLRYAKLIQKLDVRYISDVTAPIDEGDDEFVNSNVSSHGIGGKFGLKATLTPREKLTLYAGGAFSFLAGQTKATLFNWYVDGGMDDPWIDTKYTQNKVFPMLDADVGIAYSPFRNWTFKGGYYVMAWFDALNQKNFIDDVSEGHAVDRKDTVVFDGFTVSAEYVF